MDPWWQPHRFSSCEPQYWEVQGEHFSTIWCPMKSCIAYVVYLYIHKWWNYYSQRIVHAYIWSAHVDIFQNKNSRYILIECGWKVSRHQMEVKVNFKFYSWSGNAEHLLLLHAFARSKQKCDWFWKLHAHSSWMRTSMEQKKWFMHISYMW